MSEWIKCSGKYPHNGQVVLAKFWHEETEKYYEAEAKFTDHEDYRAWQIRPIEGIELICLPQEWKPHD